MTKRAIEMVPVESSNITAIGWTETDGLLVEFRGGSRYQYPGVTADEFAAFHASESKGKHHATTFKARPCVKVPKAAA
jgi:hypothetical protein